MEERGKQVHLLGVSFRTAPLAVREGLSFNYEESESLLRQARSEDPELEAAVVSTCNRTEFYLAHQLERGVIEGWLNRLRKLRPDVRILRGDCCRYQWSGDKAVEHLFRVAAGLDSAILGDVRILGQVKRSMAVASGCGTLGETLHRVFVQAIRTGKQARGRTDIGCGSASLGSALADVIGERENGDGHRTRVLIVGAGEVARDVGRHVAKGGLRDLIFVNRTMKNAEWVAEYCGGRANAWEKLEIEMRDADVIVAATRCSRPLFGKTFLEEIWRQRRVAPLCVIDAGVPRNMEEGSGVEVLHIDSVRERQKEALERRRKAMPEAEKIVAAELEIWRRWQERRPVEAMIKRLYKRARDVSREMAGALASRTGMDGEEVEKMLGSAVRKILHEHVTTLRDDNIYGKGYEWIGREFQDSRSV